MAGGEVALERDAGIINQELRRPRAQDVRKSECPEDAHGGQQLCRTT